MTRTILMGALATVLLCGAAGGAELELLGPAGAAVSLDGTPVGVLPLPGPLTLAPGDHVIEAELRGAETLRRSIVVRDDEATSTVHLRFRPFRRNEALLSSFLLAGQGQRNVGRGNLGWALTAAEVGGLLTALFGEMSLQNHKNDYDVALAAYEAAVSEAEIAATRAEVVRLSGEIDDAHGMRNLGMAVAVGAVAVSVLDLILRFPGLDTGVNLDTVGPFDAPLPFDDDPGVRLGLSLQF